MIKALSDDNKKNKKSMKRIELTDYNSIAVNARQNENKKKISHTFLFGARVALISSCFVIFITFF